MVPLLGATVKRLATLRAFPRRGLTTMECGCLRIIDGCLPAFNATVADLRLIRYPQESL